MMIVSEQKPFEEILRYLEGENKIFILGCNGCAQASGTGGPVQVEGMKGKLEAESKQITGTKVIDFLCQKALVKSGLRPRTKQIEEADSILVMTCGIGVQAVAASVNRVCHPTCNTVNLGGSRGEWEGSERCMECGDCLLDFNGGICPLTACTKSLTNGACGGASDGECELNPRKDCGWELIYERLKAKNQLNQLDSLVIPRNYSKLMPNPALFATSRWALEQSDPE